jgi:hypothetical protein
LLTVTFWSRLRSVYFPAARFAIVDGTGIATAYTYKSSNVLIKENGARRTLASHVSGVTERSPA